MGLLGWYAWGASLALVFLAVYFGLVYFHEQTHVRLMREDGVGISQICYAGWLNGTDGVGWTTASSNGYNKARHEVFHDEWNSFFNSATFGLYSMPGIT